MQSKFLKKIAVVMMMVVLTVSVTACSLGGSKKPAEVVDMYMLAITQQKTSDLQNYLGETFSFENEFITGFTEGFTSASGTTDGAEEMGKAVLASMKKVTYEIGTETITGDTATVAVAINGLDFQSVIAELIQEAMTMGMSGNTTEADMEAQLMVLLTEKIANMEPTGKITNIDVKLVKQNGMWIIEEDQLQSLMAAIFGIDESML